VQFLVFASVVSFVLFVAVGASGSGAKSAVTIPDFSVSQLSAPGGANWIQTNGNIQAQRYSTLSQIDGSNGGGLKLAWTTHLANPATPEPLGAGNQQPLVYNGVLYVQDGWGRITAMDAASGKIVWQFDPQIPLNAPGGYAAGPNARSLGMGDGMIFTGVAGTVYAINAQTGAQAWATVLVNPTGGGQIDASPLYYKGLVVGGTSGGDSGASAIAYALDAKTGKVKWHYSVIPSNPKAYGWNTWPSQRFYFGGGGLWDPPSINTKLDMVYFGTGQALPFNGLINGPGAEYGANGVYGLSVLTGKFVWFFQMVHHDIWDRDNMETPMNVTITHNGKQVDVIDSMNKSGYNFVLYAATGKPVLGVIETPVPQDPRAHTYPTQPIPVGDEAFPERVLDPESYRGVIAPDGQPYNVGANGYLGPYPAYTDKEFVVGTGFGFVNWPEPAYDPNTGVIIWCGNYSTTGFKSPAAADQHPVISAVGFGNVIQSITASPPNKLSFSRLVAVYPATNKVAWTHDDNTVGGIPAGKSGSCSSQVTTTAGGLALIGRIAATPQYPSPGVAMIQAYSVKDGSFLWQVPVLVNGQAIPTVPRITTYSVGGKQYIASFTHFGTAGPDISAYTLP
jgi:glucose dehydrogenase